MNRSTEQTSVQRAWRRKLSRMYRMSIRALRKAGPAVYDEGDHGLITGAPYYHEGFWDSEYRKNSPKKEAKEQNPQPLMEYSPPRPEWELPEDFGELDLSALPSKKGESSKIPKTPK